MKLTISQLTAAVALYVKSNKIATDTFTVTRDNVANLADTIGKIYTLDTGVIDHLSIFDGEELSFGKTVEEWACDLTLIQDYDAQGQDALAPYDPTFRPASFSYTQGRKVIPTTLRNDNIERAVHNEGQFSSVVSTILKKQYDSEAAFKYECKKELLAKAIAEVAKGYASATSATFTASSTYAVNALVNNGTEYGIIVKAYNNSATDWSDAKSKGYVIVYDIMKTLSLPVDTNTSEAFITQVKKDVEAAGFMSEGNSLNGNTLGATEGLVLLVKKGVMPVVEVQAMAGAFHENKLAVPAEVVVIDDFGSDATGTFAMLVDRRSIKLHQDYRAVRTQENGKGDFMNYFLHVEYTAHYSRNTFMKIYKA